MKIELKSENVMSHWKWNEWKTMWMWSEINRDHLKWNDWDIKSMGKNEMNEKRYGCEVK